MRNARFKTTLGIIHLSNSFDLKDLLLRWIEQFSKAKIKSAQKYKLK